MKISRIMIEGVKNALLKDVSSCLSPSSTQSKCSANISGHYYMLKCKALVRNRKRSEKEARGISYVFQFEFEMFTFLNVTVLVPS